MVPHKRTPEGKALIEEIRQINRIFSYEKTIQSFFTSGDGMHNEGFMLHFPSFGNIDGTSIDAVSVHQNCTVEVVDGLEPIKASEILAAMGK